MTLSGRVIACSIPMRKSQTSTDGIRSAIQPAANSAATAPPPINSHLRISLAPFLQPALLQPPQQHIQPVLPEKRFALERHRRHAPMSGSLMRLLVLLNDVFVLVGVFGDLCVQRREAKPGTF